jgi:hypothetical protein
MGDRQQSVSACVITYNRASIVGTCLRAVGFADEVILVDKTSTDETRAVAARFVDRIVTVPWSPTVEETRALAVSLCRHDWILLLDDDECLNPAAVRFIQRELAAPRADLYAFPLRHYILGRHDERAYYWPEHHIRLFRRDAMTLGGTVHGGMTPRSDRIMRVGVDEGPCIHHLSHPDVAGWIERTNRYTSRPDRVRAGDQPTAETVVGAPTEASLSPRSRGRHRQIAGSRAGNIADAGLCRHDEIVPVVGSLFRPILIADASASPDGVGPMADGLSAHAAEPAAGTRDLAGFAHARIDHWLAQTQNAAADEYLQAVALLRAVYDMVDRLKTWEEARGQDGAALFRQVCSELDAAHAAAATPAHSDTGPGSGPWVARVRRLLSRCLPGPRRHFVLMPTILTHL